MATHDLSAAARRLRSWALSAIISLPAMAQPLAPRCYQPDATGWVGPQVAIGCNACCGCTTSVLSMEWQVRPEASAWASQPISSISGRFANNPFPGLTHLQRYCTRIRLVDSGDAGAWGPTPTTCGVGATDQCFGWDEAPPGPPTLLDAGVAPGTNRVVLDFAPASDDGGGVLKYRLRFNGPNDLNQPPLGESTSSPLTDVLGQGTWTVSIITEDRAHNYAPTPSAPFTVSLGFDASVAVPGPPTWNQLVSNQTFMGLTWPDDGADSWLMTQRTLDGGWAITLRPHVDTPEGFINVVGPCRQHAVRLARVVGDHASAWSAPSADLLVDTVAPSAGAPSLLSVDAGVAVIQWPAAPDACPSGAVTYRLERSVDGAGWTARTTTSSLTSTQTLDAIGTLTFRVVAIDAAGNEGTSTSGATVIVTAPPPDAGPPDAGPTDAGPPDAGSPDAGPPDAGPEDAGAPDAGPPDAGPPDAGPPDARSPDAGSPDAGSPDAGSPDAGSETRQLAVGCSCTTTGGIELVPATTLVAAWRVRRRSAVRARRPAPY